MSSRAELAQSSKYENIYCFHHTYEMYAKLTAATIVRIIRHPPKRACQYVPIAIPKVNIPNLKKPVCHHFNVKVLKIFIRRAFLRTKNVNESWDRSDPSSVDGHNLYDNRVNQDLGYNDWCFISFGVSAGRFLYYQRPFSAQRIPSCFEFLRLSFVRGV